MSADMTREEISSMIELHLKPFGVMLGDANKQLAGVFANTGKLFDLQREVVDRLTKLEEAHNYTCKYQERNIGVVNERVDGIQKALNELREMIPDPKTVKSIEENNNKKIQKIVWQTAIIMFVITIIGIGYGLYSKLENQYNAIIRDKQEQQKQEAKRG